MAAPVMGLAPTSPLIADGGTSVTPVFVRIAKVPALPRITGACPVVSTAAVVNVHSTGLAIATPATFFATVVIAAVYLVFGFRPDEVGVKVAVVCVSSITTVPATSLPPVSLTMNARALTVCGSIRWLKVAVTSVPVTTLSRRFVLVGMSVAPFPGLDEITAGFRDASPEPPAASTLSIPPLAAKAADTNSTTARNIDVVCTLSVRTILFSSVLTV
jgi:hypothetical protein